MKKVLILSAGFGDGHNSAAKNIRDAPEIVSEEVKVELLDVLELTYGSLDQMARKTHLKVVQYAPAVWSGLYSLLDHAPLLHRNLGGLTKLRVRLAQLLQEAQPECVVCTYPLYPHVIAELYRDHHERPFCLITVVTDSISVNSAWFRAPSDFYCVANDATAQVLRTAGVPLEKIQALGFPVSPMFAEPAQDPLPDLERGEPKRLLYIINSGKKKIGKAIDRLLELPDTHLTITVGRDAELKAKMIERTRGLENRVRVFGWTNQMPQLLLSSHLVIGKAGGALVQEAIAAKCPMIVNQIIPGQEEGNARLIEEWNLGAVAEKNREGAEAVEQAFAWKAKRWRQWRENMGKLSRPDASLRVAELILSECDRPDDHARKVALFESAGRADPRRLLGKMTELCNFTLGQSQVEEYFAVIGRECWRAWRKFGMIVLTGIEVNKDGYTKKIIRPHARPRSQIARRSVPRSSGNHRVRSRARRPGGRLASAHHGKRVRPEHALPVGKSGDVRVVVGRLENRQSQQHFQSRRPQAAPVHREQ